MLRNCGSYLAVVIPAFSIAARIHADENFLERPRRLLQIIIWRIVAFRIAANETAFRNTFLTAHWLNEKDSSAICFE
jgi:hypothetical protein